LHASLGEDSKTKWENLFLIFHAGDAENASTGLLVTSRPTILLSAWYAYRITCTDRPS